ncbi:glycosyl hydrolase [Leptodontidium sp. MPI-SDFR-AT-0119]|nr:glycosyl hydrolase [Leptodontidium sp. MPI-SDFR-AT-0119]
MISPVLTKEASASSSVYSRPLVHFTTSTWINDPCAPGYDPQTETYHLFYQCNPYGCEWGNMSWGHVTSKDLLSWTCGDNQPVLKPDQKYDKDGAFTGCFVPLNRPGKQLTVVYSSIQNLPFFWYAPPYPRGASGIALATSEDGGRTWNKPVCNPILSEEPDGVAVTGFRDPFLAPWPALDKLLNRAQAQCQLYGLVSGGVVGSGPTAFLYDVHPDDLTTWKYLGPLVDVEPRFQPSKKWSGNYGANWECTNFLTLQDASASRHFLIMGAEGDVERDHVKSYPLPDSFPARTVRAQLWMSGDLVRKEDGVRFQYQYGGYLDYGSYYAANSFLDPKSGRQIVHGWIPEEDIPLERAREKGWNGALAIPREVFLLTIPSVVKALHSPLSEICCVEFQSQSDSSISLHTLGVRPIFEVESWRKGCHQYQQMRTPLLLPQPSGKKRNLFSTTTPSWELEATVSFRPGCEAVGFHIRHNEDLSIRTTITFSLTNETITVDRGASTISSDMNKCSESGSFTLFTTSQSSDVDHEVPEETQEKLHLRIFSDADVLEVFANDRFALATMVYSDQYDGFHGGISAFASGGDESARFESIMVWDGLNGMKSVFTNEEDLNK